jgi:hypothetical protein
MLYCPKHKVIVYKNKHRCPINSLVSLSKDCRGIADKLYALGIEMLSISHYTHPVADSYYEHYIYITIELAKVYSTSILGDLYNGWEWFTESSSITDDPLLVLSYSETFVWLCELSVDERVQEIIKEFEDYLDTTRDVNATRAVLKLDEIEIGQ